MNRHTGSRHRVSALISVLFLPVVFIGMLAAASRSFALDAPHNSTNTVSCDTCHYATADTPTWLQGPYSGDNTYTNLLCMNCHNAASLVVTDPRYADVLTHSSGQTGGTYGTWAMECITCHDPHTQRQATTYAADLLSSVATGSVLSVQISAATATIIVLSSSPPLTASTYTNHVLVPNTRYPTIMYRIIRNTATTITIRTDPQMSAALTGLNRSFAIKYGKMVKEQVAAPASGPQEVRFFRNTGANSFADSSTMLVDGICQVCHTQTSSFRSDGTLAGPGHVFQAGTRCTLCHTHKTGFAAGCNSCHGDPPVASAQGGPDGLAASEGGTGSTTPGAHGRHAVSKGYLCDTCHTGGMPASTIYDKLIQIGFSLFGGVYQSGTYDGRSSLANGYSYTRGNPGTTVTTGGSKVCTNVYCHGSTMAPNNGTDTTPQWDNPSTASCGACHGATAAVPPVRGSHDKHSRTYLSGYKYACSLCHRDPSSDGSLHGNGASEVVFSSNPMVSGGTYTGSPAMLDAYGTCTNIYCHSTVQSSPPGGAPIYRTTPVWGDWISGCGVCHDYAAGLNTGSHGKHMTYPDLQECWACHNWSNSNDGCMACHDPDTIQPWRNKHANYSIDVAFAPMYGGSYSGTPAPGDAYGSCANTYCHGNYPGSGRNAVASWGTPSTGACGTCHGVALTSGAHVWHTSTLYGVPTIPFSCGTCHNGIVSGPDGGPYAIADTWSHVNRLVDWAFDLADTRFTVFSKYSITTGAASPSDGTGRGYGRCSNLYCHSNVQGPGGIGSPTSYDTPTWTAAGGGKCGSLSCHGFGHSSAPPATGSHTKHMDFLTAWSGFLHPVLCIVCHTTDTQAAINCLYCHDTSPLWRAQHANGAIDVDFLAAYGGPTATYSGTPSPGDGYGSCADTYCHSNGTSVATGTVPANLTAAWGSGGPLTCAACHGNPPSYANGSPKANSHASASHIGAACSSCHFATTTTGTTITDQALHANTAYDIAPDASSGISFGYTYAPTGGTCSTVSCHSGGATRTWGQ